MYLVFHTLCRKSTYTMHNTTEAQELKNYIISKGVREPDAIERVMKSFSIRTKDMLSQNPQLDFNRAMDLAHQSLGKIGFRKTVQSFEEELRLDFIQTCKNSAKKNLTTILTLITFLIAGIACYFLLEACVPLFEPDDFWGVDDIAILLVLISQLISNYYLYIRSGKQIGWFFKKQHHIYQWQKTLANWPFRLYLSGIIILIPSSHYVHSQKALIFFSILFSLNLFINKVFTDAALAFQQKHMTSSAN